MSVLTGFLTTRLKLWKQDKVIQEQFDVVMHTVKMIIAEVKQLSDYNNYPKKTEISLRI